MDGFRFTEGQETALKMVEALMRAPAPQIGILQGYAGTGKTTLIKTIASLYGEPMVLCPTGKAALRVREATGLSAQTIHRFLYKPFEDEKTGETRFARKSAESVERTTNGLVVIDEASMVGRDLWEDLWDVVQILGLRILLVGDTFQLAPVETKKIDEDPFCPLTMVDTPFVAKLTEITRQALDSPILRASLLLRESSNIQPALDLLDRVFSRSFDDKCVEIYQAGGAVICHKNVTRHRINNAVRRRLGFDPSRMREGEPLLVVKNNYALDVFNGEIALFQGWESLDPNGIAVAEDRWKGTLQQLSIGIGIVRDRRVLLCPEQVAGSPPLEVGDYAVTSAALQ